MIVGVPVDLPRWIRGQLICEDNHGFRVEIFRNFISLTVCASFRFGKERATLSLDGEVIPPLRYGLVLGAVFRVEGYFEAG